MHMLCQRLVICIGLPPLILLRLVIWPCLVSTSQVEEAKNAINKITRQLKKEEAQKAANEKSSNTGTCSVEQLVLKEKEAGDELHQAEIQEVEASTHVVAARKAETEARWVLAPELRALWLLADTLRQLRNVCSHLMVTSGSPLFVPSVSAPLGRHHARFAIQTALRLFSALLDCLDVAPELTLWHPSGGASAKLNAALQLDIWASTCAGLLAEQASDDLQLGSQLLDDPLIYCVGDVDSLAGAASLFCSSASPAPHCAVGAGTNFGHGSSEIAPPWLQTLCHHLRNKDAAVKGLVYTLPDPGWGLLLAEMVLLHWQDPPLCAGSPLTGSDSCTNTEDGNPATVMLSSGDLTAWLSNYLLGFRRQRGPHDILPTIRLQLTAAAAARQAGTVAGVEKLSAILLAVDEAMSTQSPMVPVANDPAVASRLAWLQQVAAGAGSSGPSGPSPGFEQPSLSMIGGPDLAGLAAVLRAAEEAENCALAAAAAAEKAAKAAASAWTALKSATNGAQDKHGSMTGDAEQPAAAGEEQKPINEAGIAQMECAWVQRHPAEPLSMGSATMDALSTTCLGGPEVRRWGSMTLRMRIQGTAMCLSFVRYHGLC